MSLLFPCLQCPCLISALVGWALPLAQNKASKPPRAWQMTQEGNGIFFLSFFVTLNDLFFVIPIPNYVLKRQSLCICTQLRDYLLLVFLMIVPMNKTLKLSIG